MFKKLTLLLVLLSFSSSMPLYAEEIKIIAIGDSITAGTATENYRKPLGLMLEENNCNTKFVGAYNDYFSTFTSKHSAIWGIRADTVDNYYINQWIDSANPDVALIHLGTNDFLQGQSPSSTINDLSKIIDKMRAVKPNITIFLAQIIQTTNIAVSSKITIFNNQIPVLIQEKSTEQSPIYIVDQSSGFNPSVLSYDGVHPNIDGDKVMATQWYDALMKANICEAPVVTLLRNLALDKPTTTNSPYIYGAASQATNGILTTGGWFGFSYDDIPQYIQVDLESVNTIKRFELTHFTPSSNYYNTRAYEIQVSVNGNHWDTIVSADNLDTGTTNHNTEEVEARYIRLIMTNPNAYGLNSFNYAIIREFKILGN